VLPAIFNMTFVFDSVNKTCVQWDTVLCNQTDRIMECNITAKLVEGGVYWNRTYDTEVDMTKQVCVRWSHG
jgi:hypothetical protein